MVSAPTVRSADFVFLDELFAMGSGNVLNFSNHTLSRFFHELGINIDDEKYCAYGRSKAKRLRHFLTIAEHASAVRVLEALWEYREAVRKRERREDSMANAQADLRTLIARINGRPVRHNPASVSSTRADPAKLAKLRMDLIALTKLAPHPRGYAFETFLKDLFDAHGLHAREAFRLCGEQIDGSFLLTNETYLLEAKWQNPPCGAEDLHAFHGKLEQKASWARGLFISNSGFTDDGLFAFGRGKRVICMDGLDLYQVLEKGLELDGVLGAKVRNAAETGLPFVRVRDLFPT